MGEMSVSENYTHNGWFGFCPVKVGDIDGYAPLIAPRWFWLWPLFLLSEQFSIALLFLEDEPGWRIRITGERKP